MSNIEMPLHTKLQLKKKKYGVVGKQGSVKICLWTKKSLKREYACYKQRFYGVESYRCAEITPMTAICSENCTFCWRPMEFMRFKEPKEDEVDDPETLIKGILEERKRLLSGFKGNPDIDQKLLEKTYIPSHWAISLSGEPTLYPLLPELIQKIWEIKETKSVYVVSNGQHPETIQKMFEVYNGAPSQLYISIDAADEDTFKKVNRSVYEDGWQRLMKTLRIISKLPVRKVARFTLIKGLNDKEQDIEKLAEIFRMGNFDFIEIKSFMFLGYSRRRLELNNMPSFEETQEFAKKLAEHLPEYEIEDAVRMSRIVLLKNKYSPFDRWLVKTDPDVIDIKTDYDNENIELVEG